MSEVIFQGNTIHTYGELPEVGQAAPDFSLIDSDLNEKILSVDYAHKPVLINVYPSLDTSVCFNSVEKFQKALQEKNIVILGVSMDTPFALKRIGEKLKAQNIHLLSDMRNRHFGASYGVTISDGPLGGFLARAVFLLDENHQLIYQELVKDILSPPNYDAILKQVKL